MLAVFCSHLDNAKNEVFQGLIPWAFLFYLGNGILYLQNVKMLLLLPVSILYEMFALFSLLLVSNFAIMSGLFTLELMKSSIFIMSICLASSVYLSVSCSTCGFLCVSCFCILL